MQNNRDLFPPVLEARNPKQYPWAETKVPAGQCSLWRLRGELHPVNTRILGLWPHPSTLPPRSHCLLLFCVSNLPWSLRFPHWFQYLFLLHTAKHLSVTRVSCNWTQLWHHLSGRRVRYYRSRAQSCRMAVLPLPQSRANCKSKLPSALLMKPLLGLINLLEQLTKFKETLYLLDHPFIVER